VARSATSLYAANVVALASNTLYFLVLTNVLGSTLEVGIVTALNIMIWLLVTVSVMAQPITVQSPIPAPLAVLKFLPELIAKGGRADASRVLRTSFALVGGLSSLVAVLLLAAPTLVVPLLGGEEVLPLFIRLSAIDVIALALGQVCIGSLVALGDMRKATAYIVAWSAARYGFASFLLIPYSIMGVLFGWIIGDVSILLLGLIWASRHARAGSGGVSFSLIDLTRYSLYTVFSALIGFAVNQADKIVTLAGQGLRELAVYNVAIVAASFTGFAPYAVLSVLLPALSALKSSERIGEVREMIHAYSRYVSVIVIPVAFGFASVTEVALRIFGLEYVGGLAASVAVSIATGVTSIGVVYAATLLALGEMRPYTVANVVGLGSLFLVSAVLTRYLGIIGPALGRASLLAVAALMYGWSVRRRGFFELDLKAFVVSIGASGVMGLLVFAGLSQVASFLMKLALLPAFVVAGAGIYVGILRGLHFLTKEDLEFVGQVLPAKLHPFLPRLAWALGIEYEK